MGKPRMIILIRHAQSEGNKNREIHQTIPDHRVKLTSEGWGQAYEAGRRLRSMLRADDTLHFFTSPYRRTRETTEGILNTLTSDDPSPSPFRRQNIKVYEEPRLREQDFGNFQPCSAEMERMWQERADYGHFFYRIPNGESAADAYDRISGFNESLWRQFGEDDFASVCILVTHGLMSRVFLMKWYHFSVEYFEDLRNVHHCEFLIMRKKEDSGKYILENQLRTWSELKREAAQKEKDGRAEQTHENMVSSVQIRKQWGGCPNGCNHSRNYLKKETISHSLGKNSPEGENVALELTGQNHNALKNLNIVVSGPADGLQPGMIASSPGRTDSPSQMSFLRAGRDFGGSASGNSSLAGSDADTSSEDDRGDTAISKAKCRGSSGMRRGTKANALGDQCDVESDCGGPRTDLEIQEARDKSIRESVY